jgi:hypothetical protein
MQSVVPGRTAGRGRTLRRSRNDLPSCQSRIISLDGPLWGVGVANRAPPFGPSHLVFRVPSAGCPWRFKDFGLRLNLPDQRLPISKFEVRISKLSPRFSASPSIMPSHQLLSLLNSQFEIAFPPFLRFTVAPMLLPNNRDNRATS